MAMDGVSYAVSLYAEKRKSSAEDRGGSVDLAFFSGECTALAEDAMRLDRRAAFFSAVMLAATTAWVLFDVVERLLGEERESVNGMSQLHDIEVNSDIMIVFTALNLVADVMVALCAWHCSASELVGEEASNMNLFGALAHLGADMVRGLAVLLAGILAEAKVVEAAKAMDFRCPLASVEEPLIHHRVFGPRSRHLLFTATLFMTVQSPDRFQFRPLRHQGEHSECSLLC
eukprot:g30974.t1